MKIKYAITCLLCAFLIASHGCYNNKEELLYPGSVAPVDCNIVPAKFATDIFPIMTAKCTISGCHDAATSSGGVVFQNYSQISSKKDRIYIRAVIEKTMPASGILLPDERNKIKCWIDAGALNN